MKSNLDNLSYVLAFAVVNDRENLIELLWKNGVPVDSENISPEKLTEVCMNLLFVSEKFRNDFLKFISEQTGYSAAEGSSFWDGANAGMVSGLINTGLGFLANTQISKDQKSAASAQAKANLALAQAQSESNKTQLEIAKLQLAAAQLKPQNNTVLYIVLGLAGAAVLGFTIYAVTKKKA